VADRNAQIIVGLRNQASPEILKIAGDYRAFINQLQAGGATIDQAERKMLSLAQAKARTFTAAGQAARGEQELTAALGLVTTESATAYSAQTQLANIQKKVAGETGGLKQALGGLTQAFGALGIGFGVQQLVAFGKSAAEDALQLRETKNSLRAVAGDAQTYAKIIGEARQQQLLFGGSLQENIEGLSGLAVTSRQTGAQLSTLIDLQKRLTVLNPAQGAQGGLIALNEALAGNIASLSRRFNIPRAALQTLNDTTKPVAERLQVLDKFLASVGITSEAVAGKVDQGALAFRRLSQELGDLKTGVGDRLASAFTGAATGLSRLVGLINQNPQAIAELKAILGGKGSVGEADLTQATREVAASKARDQLGGSRGQPIVQQRLGQEGFHLAREQLTELNVAGGVAAEQADRLSQAFLAGGISAATYRAGLTALVGELQTSGDVEGLRVQRLASLGHAQDAVLAKQAQLAAEIQKNAQASVEDAAKKDLQQAATAKVAFETKNAADAFLRLNPNLDASQAFAAAAAAGLGPLVAEVIRLRLEADKTRAALLGEKLNSQTARQLIGADSDRAEIEAGKHAGVVAGRAKGQAEAAAAAEALRQSQAAQGNLTPAIQHAQAELNQLQKDGKGNSAEGIKKQQELRGLLSQQAAQQKTAVADQIAYAKATNNTVEARRLLNQELAAAKASGDLGEQARILNDLASLDKSRTTELNKQLTLEERIRDAKTAQLKASLDASAAIIRDRQQRRQEEQDIKTAQRILNSGRSSQQFKDAARDKIDLISIEQQQRILDINEKLKTANGQIINGRVFQSKPVGDARLAPQTQLPVGSIPQIPGPSGASGGAGGPQIEVIVTLDGQQIAANVVTRLRGGLGQASSAGAGRG